MLPFVCCPGCSAPSIDAIWHLAPLPLPYPADEEEVEGLAGKEIEEEQLAEAEAPVSGSSKL